MKINVVNTKKEIGSQQTFKFVTSPEALLIEGETPWKEKEITVEGTVTNKGQLLEVEGVIYTKAHFQCNCCLENFITSMEIPFSDNYQEYDSDLPENNTLETVYYQGDELDISDLIRESILLAEPLKPICKEDCRGLCPKCGNNLNIKECSCEKGSCDPRLAVLKQLLK